MLHNPERDWSAIVAAPHRLAVVYPAGRICARPDCGTVLNRLNPGPLCIKCEREARRANPLRGIA